MTHLRTLQDKPGMLVGIDTSSIYLILKRFFFPSSHEECLRKFKSVTAMDMLHCSLLFFCVS